MSNRAKLGLSAPLGHPIHVKARQTWLSGPSTPFPGLLEAASRALRAPFAPPSGLDTVGLGGRQPLTCWVGSAPSPRGWRAGCRAQLRRRPRARGASGAGLPARTVRARHPARQPSRSTWSPSQRPSFARFDIKGARMGS